MTERLDRSRARRFAAQFPARGWWRDATFLEDLRALAETAPDRPAIQKYVLREQLGLG